MMVSEHDPLAFEAAFGYNGLSAGKVPAVLPTV